MSIHADMSSHTWYLLASGSFIFDNSIADKAWIVFRTLESFDFLFHYVFIQTRRFQPGVDIKRDKSKKY